MTTPPTHALLFIPMTIPVPILYAYPSAQFHAALPSAYANAIPMPMPIPMSIPVPVPVPVPISLCAASNQRHMCCIGSAVRMLHLIGSHLAASVLHLVCSSEVLQAQAEARWQCVLFSLASQSRSQICGQKDQMEDKGKGSDAAGREDG